MVKALFPAFAVLLVGCASPKMPATQHTPFRDEPEPYGAWFDYYKDGLLELVSASRDERLILVRMTSGSVLQITDHWIEQGTLKAERWRFTTPDGPRLHREILYSIDSPDRLFEYRNILAFAETASSRDEVVSRRGASRLDKGMIYTNKSRLAIPDYVSIDEFARASRLAGVGTARSEAAGDEPDFDAIWHSAMPLRPGVLVAIMVCGLDSGLSLQHAEETRRD